MGRMFRSLHFQLFLWAVMPVTFVIIALSFTGVYSHQQTMRDFVIDRDRELARMAAQIAGDGLARGAVGGDGNGLDEWMSLDAGDLQGTMMVIDRTGRALAHSQPNLVGTSLRGTVGVDEALMQRIGFSIVQDDGDPVLVTFQPVEGTDWTVIIYEPVKDLIGPILRFPSLIPVVAVGAGLLSLLILLFGWRTIVRPTQQLAQAAEQVSWGDYSAFQTIQPSYGAQEIRDLGQAILDMVERIRGYEAGMHDYLGAVTQGQEAERARLARELHDGPVQGLIALGQRAEMAERLIERGQIEQAQVQFEELRQAETTVVQELRRLIGALRPLYLEDLGFLPAIEMLVRQADERAGAQVRLQHGQTIYRFAPDVELAAYRIVQEALNNALEHAQAKTIAVRVHCQDQVLSLAVADDGIGFSLPEHPSQFTQDGHFGLLGMQERASSIGGSLRIDTAPSRGTTVTARLPATSLVQ